MLPNHGFLNGVIPYSIGGHRDEVRLFFPKFRFGVEVSLNLPVFFLIPVHCSYKAEET